MADDNLLAGLSGFAEGAKDVLGLIIQDRLNQRNKQTDLMNQSIKSQQDFNRQKELEGYKSGLRIQEEQAKPRTVYQLVDPMTKEFIGDASTVKPVGIGNSRVQQTEQEKQDAKTTSKLQQMKPKARKALDNFSANLDITIGQIDELLNNPNTERGTGFTGKIESKFPGTTAKDIRGKIKSIQSAVSLDQLTELRNSSPTGGALGQVSDAEGIRLESAKANIDPDQSPEQVKKELERLKNVLIQSKQRARSAYTADFGEEDLINPNMAGSQYQGNNGLPSVGQEFNGGKVKSIKRIK